MNDQVLNGYYIKMKAVNLHCSVSTPISHGKTLQKCLLKYSHCLIGKVAGCNEHSCIKTTILQVLRMKSINHKYMDKCLSLKLFFLKH